MSLLVSLPGAFVRGVCVSVCAHVRCVLVRGCVHAGVCGGQRPTTGIPLIALFLIFWRQSFSLKLELLGWLSEEPEELPISALASTGITAVLCRASQVLEMNSGPLGGIAGLND